MTGTSPLSCLHLHNHLCIHHLSGYRPDRKHVSLGLFINYVTQFGRFFEPRHCILLRPQMLANIIQKCQNLFEHKIILFKFHRNKGKKILFLAFGSLLLNAGIAVLEQIIVNFKITIFFGG